MRRYILLLLLLLLPAVAHAADVEVERPHWSLELKGGMFIPAIENWSAYYGSRSTSHYAGALAYKIFRQVEAGIEGGLIVDRGTAFAPIHSVEANTTVYAGRVIYDLYPVSIYLLARGVFSENQWVVPYVGGGWTRIYYREEIKDQGIARGSVDGTNGRVGLQFLLDGIDSSAANSFYLDFGVIHTYLFIEAQRTRAMIGSPSVNIGGTSYLAGFLFEF